MSGFGNNRDEININRFDDMFKQKIEVIEIANLLFESGDSIADDLFSRFKKKENVLLHSTIPFIQGATDWNTYIEITNRKGDIQSALSDVETEIEKVKQKNTEGARKALQLLDYMKAGLTFALQKVSSRLPANATSKEGEGEGEGEAAVKAADAQTLAQAEAQAQKADAKVDSADADAPGAKVDAADKEVGTDTVDVGGYTIKKLDDKNDTKQKIKNATSAFCVTKDDDEYLVFKGLTSTRMEGGRAKSHKQPAGKKYRRRTIKKTGGKRSQRRR